MRSGTFVQYFVAIAFEADAVLHLGAGIQVTLPASGVMVEDADHDIPLVLMWQPDVTAGPVVPLPDPTPLFADDFESGDVSAWSTSVS